MRNTLVISLVVVVILAGLLLWSSGSEKAPASSSAETHVVQRVHETKEWQRIAATLDETRKYYSVRRTWPAAKLSEERRMEKTLVLALYNIQRLVEMKGLSQAEAELLKEQIVEMPYVGTFRTRTVVHDDEGVWPSTIHHNGTRCSPKGISYSPQWMRSPLAEVMPHLYVGMPREELDALLVKHVVAFRTINNTYYLFADGYIILPPDHTLDFVEIHGDRKPYKWRDRWQVEYVMGKRRETKTTGRRDGSGAWRRCQTYVTPRCSTICIQQTRNAQRIWMR